MVYLFKAKQEITDTTNTINSLLSQLSSIKTWKGGKEGGNYFNGGGDDCNLWGLICGEQVSQGFPTGKKLSKMTLIKCKIKFVKTFKAPLLSKNLKILECTCVGDFLY